MPVNEDTIYFFPDEKGPAVPLKPKTRYQTAKEGWGDRKNFQGSYGLGMDPDSFEEGNAILDAFREGEYVVDKKQQKRDQTDQQQRLEARLKREEAEQQQLEEARLKGQQARVEQK